METDSEMTFRFATAEDTALIRFYKSLGAEVMSDWTVYRNSGETLKKLGFE